LAGKVAVTVGHLMEVLDNVRSTRALSGVFRFTPPRHQAHFAVRVCHDLGHDSPENGRGIHGCRPTLIFKLLCHSRYTFVSRAVLLTLPNLLET
jgi:hypothetical protein